MGTEDIQNKEGEADRDCIYLTIAKSGAVDTFLQEKIFR